MAENETPIPRLEIFYGIKEKRQARFYTMENYPDLEVRIITIIILSHNFPIHSQKLIPIRPTIIRQLNHFLVIFENERVNTCRVCAISYWDKINSL